MFSSHSALRCDKTYPAGLDLLQIEIEAAQPASFATFHFYRSRNIVVLDDKIDFSF